MFWRKSLAFARLFFIFGRSQWRVRPFFLFLLVVLASVGLMWPALFGAFLLDDNANLDSLFSLKAGDGWLDWAGFVVGGRSGPGGRPLSLLSFALQHAFWPGLPSHYKVVNLALHVINGLLLHRLIMKTGRLAAWPEYRTHGLAVLAPMVWLLHPIQVSTVFYVIQRMTLLTALFVLAGMLVYLKGREWMAADRDSLVWQNRGLFLCGMGLMVGGLLAVLSKENGALLPIFLLVMETTLLSNLPWPERLKHWRTMVLHGPWVLMVIYIIVQWNNLLSYYVSRNFSMTERLLTELRIVTEYLKQIISPRIGGFSLFHDDYVISHSLTQPLSTLGSLIFLSSLALAALLLRHRMGWISFGILWFFAGHLMESTIFPLELYFEHRNYLPLFGIAFMLVWSILSLYHRTRNIRGKVLTGILGMVIVGQMVFVSRAESVLWGDPFRQAMVWGHERPNSARALLQMGKLLYSADLVDVTLELFDKYQGLNPEDPTAQLVKLKILCDHPESGIVVDGAFIQEVTRKQGGNKATIVGILEFTVMVYEKGQCKVLDAGTLLKILLGYLQNPSYGGAISQNNLHLLVGRVYARMGNLNASMEHYDLSQAYDLRLDTYLQQVKWLISAGLLEDARIYFEKAQKVRGKNWLVTVIQKRQLEFYGRMLDAVESAAKGGKPGPS